MKYFVAIVTACCLAAFATVSRAESQDYVIFHGASKHSTLPGQVWQERNYGISYRYQQDKTLGYQVGTYRNSYNKQTVYGVVQYTPIGNDVIRAGLFGGVANGYAMPVVGGFMLNYHQGKAVYTVRHVPKIAANAASVTTFEMGFRF